MAKVQRRFQRDLQTVDLAAVGLGGSPRGLIHAEMARVLGERHLFVLGEREGRFAGSVPAIFIASATITEVIDVEGQAWRIGDRPDGRP